MCGLAGIFTGSGGGKEQLEQAVARMIEPLEHRGPDDSGTWVEAAAGLALGHRRLSIIDLSQAGHQPMASSTGRFIMIFNGEVYNFADLRRGLEREGWRFHGHSDSEVILAAFERWGIEGAARRFVGMFAIAVWDSQRRSLSLLRDRLGIKPLFVHSRPGLVTFGSELKALSAGPGFEARIDPAALTAYLRYLYVPAPHSIFQHTHKLPPGHILTLSDPTAELPPSRPYWSAEEAARQGLSDPFAGSEREAVDELDRLLTDAVALRMIADVPLGALLSGGIDSSTVVSLMQSQSDRPIKTFTIGFEGRDYNEAPYARRLAQHLGTDHTELMLTGDDALAVVPRLAEMFDEPFADPSQIPTFLVCELARRQVTVALSGDGGDEVFAGYNRYSHGERIIQRLQRVPKPIRRTAAAAIAITRPDMLDRVHHALAPILPASLHHRLPGEKLQKLGDLMDLDSVSEMYRSLLSAWQRPERLVVEGRADDGTVERVLASDRPVALLERMMLADQLTYLADDLLAKVDRASMAVSLEARVPLLDHRVVEFAWRLPRRLKIRNGHGKWALREVLYRRVPREIVDRPKMGFSVPIDRWLRGPLRPWAESLLTRECLERHGVLRAEPIVSAWRDFQSRRRHEAMGFWALLMFQAWSDRWLR